MNKHLDILPPFWPFVSGVLIMLALIVCLASYASAETIDVNRLANAIYKAEGGAKTRHPYGILAKYKHTSPRQACINTINSAIRRYNKSNLRSDFIVYLSKTYCPIGAKNDPTGLNVNWVKNVRYYYKRG